MKLISRILFFISIIVLGLYSFDVVEKSNKAFLFIFMIGFTASFVLTFLTENSKWNNIIRWISAVIVIGNLGYILIFGFLWSFAKTP